jgi:hypothetical protein
MDVDNDAIPLPEPLRQTDVVAVTMSQHDASNVMDGTAQLCQLMVQLTPVTRQTRVDDRDPRTIHNQVNVDDIGADLMQTGCEPHRIISLCATSLAPRAQPCRRTTSLQTVQT